jgi:uncharacterized damage-inducible protein DinB
MYQQNLELLRTARVETLRLCEGIGQAQSEQAPRQGKWSLGEVLDHLVLAEQYYREVFVKLVALMKSGAEPVVNNSFADVNSSIGYLPKSMLPLVERPFNAMNRFVPRAFREMMIGRPLIPAQTPDFGVPQKAKPLEGLKSALESSYRATAYLFESNPDAAYQRMRYRHPLMGDNDGLQLLRILSLHERRHQGQIKEILRVCSARS